MQLDHVGRYTQGHGPPSGAPGIKRIIALETLAQGTLYTHGPWTPGLYSACVFCRHFEDDDLLAGFMYFLFV